MSTTVIIHGTEQADPRSRTRVQIRQPGAQAPGQRAGRVEIGTEGTTHELGDAMKTRVTIHGPAPEEIGGQGAHGQGAGSRVILHDEPQQPMAPQQVLVQLEHEHAQLSAQKKTLETQLRDVSRAIRVTRQAVGSGEVLDAEALKAAGEAPALGAGDDSEDDGTNTGNGDDNGLVEIPSSASVASKAELVELAASLGIEVQTDFTKAQIYELILQHTDFQDEG